MLNNVRYWLATKILAKDSASLAYFGTNCISTLLDREGAESICWKTTRGRSFIAGEAPERRGLHQVTCRICTGVFSSNPDKPAHCPYCGSTDVTLAPQP